jgi:hypothetical protein
MSRKAHGETSHPLFTRERSELQWCGTSVQCHKRTWGLFGTAVSDPLCTSTVVSQIDSPIPMPFGFVVKERVENLFQIFRVSRTDSTVVNRHGRQDLRTERVDLGAAGGGQLGHLGARQYSTGEPARMCRVAVAVHRS